MLDQVDCTGWFVLDKVGNLEDQFCHVAVQVVWAKCDITVIKLIHSFTTKCRTGGQKTKAVLLGSGISS